MSTYPQTNSSISFMLPASVFQYVHWITLADMWDIWDTNMHGVVRTRNHIKAHSKLRKGKAGAKNIQRAIGFKVGQ